MKIAAALPYSPSLALIRASDFLQMVRPGLGLMALVTVGSGWLIARGWEPDWSGFACAMVGTALAFAGASALNQVFERQSDALMPRTANRPLPAGRIRPISAMALGCTLCGGGLVCLLSGNQILAAALCSLALVGYVFIYTPLKRQTTLSTLIGAIPGALLPLIGWAAAAHQLDGGALVLFLILFLWQIPHFLAIAWIYRDEYARAGLYVLPVFDPDGVQTGRQMTRYTFLLLLACLMHFVLGHGSWISGLGTSLLGVFFLNAVLVFARKPSTDHARQVFRTSLLFLPGLLLLFVLDATLFNGT